MRKLWQSQIGVYSEASLLVGRRLTCPNSLRRRDCILCSMVVLMLRRSRILVKVLRSILDFPRIAQRQSFSKTRRFRLSSAVSVHVSDAYVAIGRIKLLYSLTLRASPISRRDHMFDLSRPT